MRRFLYQTIGILAASIFITGCKKEDSVRTSLPKPERRMESMRTKIVHLYKDTVYTLTEQFSRNDGEQLIIDEGTIIKVDMISAPSITINPGGLLIANGTANNPIIFTGNSLPGNQKGNWGGIIINGKSTSNSTSQPGDITDISGSLDYVRIEFANLVLNKVGSRTSIQHVQVSYANPRSAFEIHGGSFNAKFLLSYACGGPADFYFTEGYEGLLQNLLAYRHPFFGNTGFNPGNALAGVFIENNPFNPVDARPYTYPLISNLTVIGTNGQPGSTAAYSDTTILSAALVTTNSTGFRIRNSLLMGFPVGGWYLGDTLTAAGIRDNYSELTYSILHSNDADRVFYMTDETYRPATAIDFRNYMMDQRFHNQVFDNMNKFMLKDPFNYDNAPDPLPATGSPVLKGANFEGAVYSNPFFTKTEYLGAIGNDDWIKGWTNFMPLKTSYNSPK